MQQLTNYIKEREVQFDKDFTKIMGRNKVENFPKEAFYDIKSFQSQTIKGIIEQIEEMCKEMKRPEEGFELPEDMEFGRGRLTDFRVGYNDALSNLCQHLSEVKKEL